MPPSKSTTKKKSRAEDTADEALEYFAKFDEAEEQKANRLLKEFHQRSELLAETEIELAQQMQSMLEPFKTVFEETHKHTQFRSALYSLFLDPTEKEVLELYKYEQEFE
jgi:tryptophanyl-tRNA synthetase